MAGQQEGKQSRNGSSGRNLKKLLLTFIISFCEG